MCVAALPRPRCASGEKTHSRTCSRAVRMFIRTNSGMPRKFRLRRVQTGGTCLVQSQGERFPSSMALPFGETSGARDARALAILAKTIYRELRSSGFETRDVIALAGELLGQVTTEVKSRASSSGRPRGQ